MASPLLKKKMYSYADYLEWPDDGRWELINGTLYDMSPAPSTRHQDVSWELAGQIHHYLSGKTCRGYAAPFDVRFPEGIRADDEIIDVVQPDILVVCDLSKLDDKGYQGAPDFIIEIISPSTASKDYITKRQLYEKNGVKEYWIVHPIDKVVQRYLLENGKYNISIHEGKGSLEVVTLPGLVIDLDLVFKEV